MRKRPSEYLISISVAWMLAVWLFALFSPNLEWWLESLQANIVGTKENVALGEFVQETYNNSARMEANIVITDIESISVFVLYDPDEVNPNFDEIVSWASFVYSQDAPWAATLILTDVPDLMIKDELLQLPIDGDSSKLVFSDMNIIFTDKEETSVSITVQ